MLLTWMGMWNYFPQLLGAYHQLTMVPLMTAFWRNRTSSVAVSMSRWSISVDSSACCTPLDMPAVLFWGCVPGVEWLIVKLRCKKPIPNIHSPTHSFFSTQNISPREQTYPGPLRALYAHDRDVVGTEFSMVGRDAVGSKYSMVRQVGVSSTAAYK